MKLATIIDPRFTEAYRKLIDTSMPMKTAYKLKKIATQIVEEQKMYEESRRGLLSEFGDKNKDGSLVSDENGMVKMSGDNGRIFVEKHRELLEIDIDVGTVSIEDMGNISVTTNDLIILDGIFKD